MSTIKAASQVVKDKVQDTHLAAGRNSSDTIRLWENYKDQALMWRSLALMQIPATSIALIFAVVFWVTREITLQVPSKPLPGIYAAQDIPDTEFINVANDYISLIATYQPQTARKQFEAARGMLKEPLLTKFNEEMMASELVAIENTQRTQVFFGDPLRTRVVRKGQEVEVTLVGERVKFISGQALPSLSSRYRVRMTTIPKNQINPYGIVITSVVFKANLQGEERNDTGEDSIGVEK